MAPRQRLCSVCLALALCPVGAHAQDAGLRDAGAPSSDASLSGDASREHAPSEDAPPEDAAREGEEGGRASQPAPPRLIPPRIVRSAPPAYPESRLGERLHPSVVLIVTLDPDGHVVDAEVEHSADADFDAAARAAVRTWEFAAAERDGQPIASRVRVAVHFELPAFDLARGAEPMEAGGVVEPVQVLPHHDHPAPDAAAEIVEEEGEEDAEPELGVTAQVEHEERDEDRGAGSFEIDRDVLAAAPRREGADLLLSVPGVFAARAEGMAVGHRINLRGFDADHGQDIELSVGGLPINLPSHIHGQGYADLGFLIPEAVRRVRATEGVYDPRQGDFAVAGSIAFDLGVPEDERGFRVQSGYGLFDTFEQLVLWAPEGEREETLGAVQYRRTGGFGQRRSGDAISAIVQAGARSGDWRLRGVGILYGARADLAGVVRVDDLQAGRVGYYDAYPDPTAQSQNALSGRFLAGFFADHRSEGGAGGGLGVWVGADAFRLQENFTGYTRRSRTVFDGATGRGVAGRGDLIEQRNRTFSAGLQGRFRTSPWEPWDWASARLELGLDGRVDFLEQGQSLIEAGRNRTWDELIDADVFTTNAALYGDVEIALTEYVELHVGARAALAVYEIDDRLGNFIAMERPETFLRGFRRSAGGVTAGPRASVEVKPIEPLSLRAAYGHGYRSPQARTLDDGERAPFTEVRSADLGAVLELDRILRVQVAGFWTELSDDVAFEPREGRLERIGASRRIGAVLHAQARPLDWLVGAVSVTFVDAELLEPPPPSASDPQPAFMPGQNLPYVPPVVIRADLGARSTLAEDVLGEELRGHVGLGYSFLSPRPLPFGGFADPVNLVDASAGLGWGPVDLGVSFFNIFDVRYAASEFVFTSSWDPDAVPTRVPARHLSAGSPFTFMVTLGVSP